MKPVVRRRSRDRRCVVGNSFRRHRRCASTSGNRIRCSNEIDGPQMQSASLKFDRNRRIQRNSKSIFHCTFVIEIWFHLPLSRPILRPDKMMTTMFFEYWSSSEHLDSTALCLSDSFFCLRVRRTSTEGEMTSFGNWILFEFAQLGSHSFSSYLLNISRYLFFSFFSKAHIFLRYSDEDDDNKKRNRIKIIEKKGFFFL